MKNYRNLDDFVDCMGGNLAELQEIAKSPTFADFLSSIPYTIEDEDDLESAYTHYNTLRK